VTHQTGRLLLTPDEVRNFSAETELLFLAGSRRIAARKLRYYADREFAGLSLSLLLSNLRQTGENSIDYTSLHSDPVMWSVAEAKAQLSEVLRKARGGSPQVIGTQDPCVVVSLETYQNRLAEADHDGKWLIDMTSRLGLDISLPFRKEDRADPVLGE
jgi:hypothetical protein